MKLLAILLSFLITLSLFTACSTSAPPMPTIALITPTPHLTHREMDYTGFTKVEVSSAFEVDITRADSYLVSITAYSNLFEHLNIKKSDNTLHIVLKRGKYDTTTLKATITMPALHGLKLSGTSKGRVAGFSSANSLDLNLSGASSLVIDNLQAGDTVLVVSEASKVSGTIKMADGRFGLSGTSNVELTGSGKYMSIKASGASKLDLVDFPVRYANINLSGGSNATIKVNGRLDANLSGASTLYYSGDTKEGNIDVSNGSKALTK